MHPEDRCQVCLGPNPSWVVDSDRFNAAMEALGLDRAAIVCPNCFIVGHQIATCLVTSWELVPGTPFRPADVE